MSILGGPVSVVLVAAALIAAVIMWVSRRRRYPAVTLVTDDEAIDREELDAAEREVRDLDLEQQPDDGFEGDDWGPGAARRPRSPLEL